MSDEGPTSKLPQVSSYDRLARLGEHRIALVDDMLIMGKSSHEVARVIQEEWQESTDVSHEAIRKMLDRYKARELAPRIAVFIGKNEENALAQKRARKLAANIDVMAELTEMYKIQRRRVDKLLSREESLPTLVNTVRAELDTAAKLVKDIAFLQLETGILRRAPKQITGTLGSVDEEGNRSLTQFFVQQSEGGRGADDEVRRLLEDAISTLEAEYTEIKQDDDDSD